MIENKMPDVSAYKRDNHQSTLLPVPETDENGKSNGNNSEESLSTLSDRSDFL
jgi:hypothetical protein